jgi:hypothetical protein
MENRRYYSHTFSFALPVVVLAGVRADSISSFALSILGCLFMAALYADRLKYDLPVETPWRWSVMAGMFYVVALIGLKHTALEILGGYSWLGLIVAVAMPPTIGALVARWTARRDKSHL